MSNVKVNSGPIITQSRQKWTIPSINNRKPEGQRVLVTRTGGLATSGRCPYPGGRFKFRGWDFVLMVWRTGCLQRLLFDSFALILLLLLETPLRTTAAGETMARLQLLD